MKSRDRVVEARTPEGMHDGEIVSIRAERHGSQLLELTQVQGVDIATAHYTLATPLTHL